MTALDQTALVVLAAGRSSRMGFPKALTELDGRTVLEHLLLSPVLSEIGDVIVVLGHHAERLQPIVRSCGRRYVINPEPDRGRTGSIQAGLAALASSSLAVFLQPVDCPLIESTTYTKLSAAIDSAEVVIPSFQGQHGHPPLFSAATIPTVISAKPDKPLRDLLHAPRIRRSYVEVDDPGVLLNVDRPDDVQALIDLYQARRT